MKKVLIGLGIVVAFIILVVMYFIGKYNTMVGMDEGVKGAWAQVENVYQRRADLIPNLVNTVKGAANFEKDTLTAVIAARSRATSVTIDPTNITPAMVAKFQKAQDGLSGALSRLLVTVERYPDIKANRNFLDLQAQLEGTENRIAVERKRFNTVVVQYNTVIRTFPNSLVAGLGGFFPKGYFQATTGADTPPTVDFQ